MNKESIFLSSKDSIREWPIEDRPREKLLEQGSHALTNAELLGILIGSGTLNMNSVKLAKKILKSCDHSLDNLAKYSIKELQKFKGIGIAKAVAIVSAMELTRRREKSFKKKRIKVGNSRDSYELIRRDLLDKKHEEVWVILTDHIGTVLKKHQISKGGLSSTLIDSSVLFRSVVEYSASGFILVHNHPSNNPFPSEADKVQTKKILEGAATLNINFIDHIIFCEDAYYSFADYSWIL